MKTPVGVAEDLDGNLYVTNYGGSIIKVFPDGTTRPFSNDFGRPGVGIDISLQNEIFAVDNGDGCVRIISQDGSTNIVVDGISGCVALLIHGNTLYVGSWGTGAVYEYRIIL
ncbi:serine/threonine-protein kinase [Treponema primitia ZAS-2]|uniref:Serine/threonine-protein kinase n=1 Tax=Treponema primitia (strain ATCC BAA-887 / DSM 12427 / ZAS-2) TaxID=545694 RepID=F5YQE7_TREPZ|nr:serine/threonine protein kinase [Treponema primitia]AEF85947.1 serine/threonine-protein kinase [Treponema primitia ZAS-2]